MNHRVFYPRPHTPYRKPTKFPKHRPMAVTRALLGRLNRPKSVYYRNRYVQVDRSICHLQICSRPFELGDMVINSGKYYFHQCCYESLFLECPEPTEEELKETTIIDETPS